MKINQQSATFLLVCSLLVFLGCSRESESYAGGAPAGNVQTVSFTNPSTTMQPTNYDGNVHEVYDPQLRQLAFRISTPDNWTVQSQLNWNNQHLVPLSVYLQVQSTDGRHQVSCFPTITYTWSEGYGLDMVRQEGMQQGGVTYKRPGDVQQEAVSIIQQLRPGASHFKVESIERASGLIQRWNIQLDNPINNQQLVVTTTYQEGGQVYRDRFYVIRYLIEQHNGYISMHYRTYELRSERAPANQFQQSAPTLEKILHAIHAEPAYTQKCKGVVAQIQQQQLQQGYASIHSARQLSNSITANNNAFYNQVEQWRQDFNKPTYTGGTNSGNTGFSDYIRGTQRADDPYWGKNWEIESGYKYNWTDGQGNWKSSNDATYNPNIGSNQNWTLHQGN